MAATGTFSCGIGGVISENRPIRRHFGTRLQIQNLGFNRIGIQHRRLRFENVIRNCGLISDQEALDYDLNASKLDERLAETRERLVNGSIDEPIESLSTSPPCVQTELVLLALSAIAGQAIKPLAQLMETAYIGRLCALELASAGND